jgi:hypothetical protein
MFTQAAGVPGQFILQHRAILIFILSCCPCLLVLLLQAINQRHMPNLCADFMS